MADGVSRLAGALSRHAERTVDRRGRRAHVAEVVALEPLEFDVPELNARLGLEDVSVGAGIDARLVVAPLTRGDTVVLVEIANGDYSLVEVHRVNSAEAPVVTGGDKTYRFPPGPGSLQPAATTWTMNHGLGKIPSWRYFDHLNNPVEPGDEQHPNSNTTIATFSPATSGWAVAN